MVPSAQMNWKASLLHLVLVTTRTTYVLLFLSLRVCDVFGRDLVLPGNWLDGLYLFSPQGFATQ